MTGPACCSGAELIDYWLAELPDGREEAVEEHLLGCAGCSRRLEELATLTDGIRRVARQGRVRFVVTQEFLERAAREGLRVRQYAPPAGGSVNCTVTPADDLLIGRLGADFSGAGRVDLALCDGAGNERERIPDVPVDRAAGEVIVSEPVARALLMPANVLVMKLFSIGEQGEQLLGEYTFNHTPS